MKITQPNRKMVGTGVGQNENNHSRVLDDIYKALRGNISFGSLNLGDVSQNIKGILVQVVSNGISDTDFTVTHNLNEIPTGFIILNKNKAGDVYAGSVAWTNTQITLRCTVASVTLTLFITAT